jgi:DNA-binding HxlR family transcriptional regulator
VIWRRLSNGIGRFGEVQRAIPQVTKKMLTQQLRELERDGVVHRRVYSEVPPRVEYSLTEYGRSLAPVMDAICGWGADHLRRAETAGQRTTGATTSGGFASSQTAD